jgi:hypothetical protein
MASKGEDKTKAGSGAKIDKKSWDGISKLRPDSSESGSSGQGSSQQQQQSEQPQQQQDSTKK